MACLDDPMNGADSAGGRHVSQNLPQTPDLNSTPSNANNNLNLPMNQFYGGGQVPLNVNHNPMFNHMHNQQTMVNRFIDFSKYKVSFDGDVTGTTIAEFLYKVDLTTEMLASRILTRGNQSQR